MKELELYIHIPFCAKKCNYCDFLSVPSRASKRQEYVESLCRRIRCYRDSAKAYAVTSIFLGGGTPSILEGIQTGAILQAVYDTFAVKKDAEITIEMNPGTVTWEKLKIYRECGINRLSIGLQSADNRELKVLGRIHTYEEFLDTYRMARAAKFENINVDLLSAIPHQTLKGYEQTLKTVAELDPEHISAYSLIIEKGTPFYDRYGDGEHAEELPDEDTERQMYLRTKGLLEEYGYHRYEISNYAKKGYECRHNMGYWERKEYLGIGMGASSFMNHSRWREGEKPVQLTCKEEMEEFMFLGLRKIKGVTKKEFQEAFGESMDSVYGPVLRKLAGQGLLADEDDSVRLTDRGIDVSNYVLSDFL